MVMIIYGARAGDYYYMTDEGVYRMTIEVIVQNAEEAKRAERLGADRLELVAAISEGGLTPSYGTIKTVFATVDIPVQVMIRPHSYHFNYTDMEWLAMQEDIQTVINLGGEGIVIGALTKDNKIDEEILGRLFQAFPNLEVTFHRAIDETFDLIDAYKTLTKYPIKRILTSGGADNCVNGMDTLKELEQLSRKMDGPIIMPGAGLTVDNIDQVHKHVQAKEYHFGKAVRRQGSFQEDFSEDMMQRLANWKSEKL